MKKMLKVTKCNHVWSVEVENDLQPNSMMEEGVQITPFVVAKCNKCKKEIDSDEINKILNIYAGGY